jgi:hypothetical protein
MFDFAKTLHDLDTRFHWDINPLTGGLVNSTVRATKKHAKSETPSDNGDQATAGSIVDLSPYPTLVAKHAPPYVATIGPDAPFSQFRQVRTTHYAVNLGSSSYY